MFSFFRAFFANHVFFCLFPKKRQTFSLQKNFGVVFFLKKPCFPPKKVKKNSFIEKKQKSVCCSFLKKKHKTKKWPPPKKSNPPPFDNRIPPTPAELLPNCWDFRTSFRKTLRKTGWMDDFPKKNFFLWCPKKHHQTLKAKRVPSCMVLPTLVRRVLQKACEILWFSPLRNTTAPSTVLATAQNPPVCPVYAIMLRNFQMACTGWALLTYMALLSEPCLYPSVSTAYQMVNGRKKIQNLGEQQSNAYQHTVFLCVCL